MLKRFAKRFKIHLGVLAQLNREVEKRSDKKPILADLRDSGQIEQDADVIMLLHRPEEPGDEEFDPALDEGGPAGAGGANPPAGMPGSNAELIIAKQRNGPTGVCPLVFWKRYLRFESRSQRGM
jgi:replicative DNA helicase